MKQNSIVFRAWAGWVGVVVISMVANLAIAGAPLDGHAERLAVLSRLQVLAQGTYTQAEWQEVTRRLDNLLDAAKARGDGPEVVETQLIRARVLSMERKDGQALELLRSTLQDYRSADFPAVKKLYVEMAAIYARQGNDQGVAAIMNEFKSSRHFDGEIYSFSGGTGPGDPVVVPRPKSAGDDSISVTAMQVSRTKSQFTAGREFPDFEAIGWDGRPVRLTDFRGQVLFVDFWSSGWFIWQRDVAYRQNMYQRLQREGLQILGMNIEADPQNAKQFVQANRLPWPQAVPPRTLLKELGIFGETTNFLLDRQGTIVGRDLYGADLEAAVRMALKR